MTVGDVQVPVTRRDIESKLREIRGEVDTAATAARPVGLAVAAATAAAVLAAAYLLGRRRGRRKSTWLEIRRV